MIKYLPLLALVFLPFHAEAAIFYADFTSTGVAHNGTSTSTPFTSINAYTDAARAAGDCLFVRRNRASTTGVAAATFTTDGTLNNPICLSADYDDLWNDFASSTATWSPTFGSTFIGSNASSSGFTTTNNWIYIQSDCGERPSALIPAVNGINNCQFAYEVQSASSTGIQLFLPYKGGQAGTGKNLRIMPSAPQIGTITEAAQIITMSQDGFWSFLGFDLRSTASGCVVTPGGGSETIFKDIVLQTDGTSACGYSGATGIQNLSKIRSFGGLFTGLGAPGAWSISDLFVDCNSVANSRAFSFNSSAMNINVSNGTIQNCTQAFNFSGIINNGTSGASYTFKNLKNNFLFNALSGGSPLNVYFEDNFSVPGLNSQTPYNVGSNTTATTTISDTSNLRAGGGPKNTLVFPPAGNGNTGISPRNLPFSAIKLFEYPIYTVANVQKTVTAYYNSTSTAQWQQNPLDASTATSSPELWLECEYYNGTVAGSLAERIVTRSATTSSFVVNFAGSTAWQPLSVTFTPTQTGITYCRSFYAKPRELPGVNTKPNLFFVDNTISVQ